MYLPSHQFSPYTQLDTVFSQAIGPLAVQPGSITYLKSTQLTQFFNGTKMALLGGLSLRLGASTALDAARGRPVDVVRGDPALVVALVGAGSRALVGAGSRALAAR